MLWRFQREIVFVLLFLAAAFLFRLKAEGNRPKKIPVATLANYQEAFTREILLENQRLRNLLNLKSREGISVASFAEVIAVDPVGWPIWVTVQTDSAGRVKPGFTVLDAKGNLVGRVAEEEAGRVKVMTILNPQSRVSVSIQESRELGILESTGPLNLKVGYVPNEAAPKEGEPVITSRLSRNYRSGIPVGTVLKSSAGKGFFREVLIRPGVDFSTLEEVVIVY